MSSLVAAASPSPLWYLTRGSGVVALLLLTASILLGVMTSRRWRLGRLPRFVVAGLHRNLTLLAVAFVGVHVGTTVADRFTQIGVKDAFVPFVSSYRPVWVGLGALACDVLLALVLTSLLRARIGYRSWRAAHWLAYLSWPLALVHGLGTGSDARFGWMAGLAAGCLLLVAVAVVGRIATTSRGLPQLALAFTTVAAVIAVGVWYRAGPARHGWAARAGTPRTILATGATTVSRSPRAPAARPLPRRFAGKVAGRLSESLPDGNGLVTVRIDARVRGAVPGQLKLALRGFPTEGGGVSMTSSGVAFGRAGGSSLYEGSIVHLDGNRVSVDLTAPQAGRLHLALVFVIDAGSGTVSGTVQGVRA